jgi:hypothetical protein
MDTALFDFRTLIYEAFITALALLALSVLALRFLATVGVAA